MKLSPDAIAWLEEVAAGGTMAMRRLISESRARKILAVLRAQEAEITRLASRIREIEETLR